MRAHEQAAGVLSDAADLLEETGIPFVLEGGTLLGAIREGDFCEGDWNDIDLTTIEPATRRNEYLDLATSRGFRVKKRHKKWAPGKKYTAVTKIQRDGVTVDLFWKEIKGEWAWWARKAKGRPRVYRRVPARHYIDTDVITFHGREYPIPSDVESYLALRYGDWRTPVPRSVYDTQPKPYFREATRVGSYDDI